MGTTKGKIKSKDLNQCETIAKSTKKRCQEWAYMIYDGKYYCGNHYPYDKVIEEIKGEGR